MFRLAVAAYNPHLTRRHRRTCAVVPGPPRRLGRASFGIPEGSIASWLARVRALLAQWLTTQGLDSLAGVAGYFFPFRCWRPYLSPLTRSNTNTTFGCCPWWRSPSAGRLPRAGPRHVDGELIAVQLVNAYCFFPFCAPVSCEFSWSWASSWIDGHGEADSSCPSARRFAVGAGDKREVRDAVLGKRRPRGLDGHGLPLSLHNSVPSSRRRRPWPAEKRPTRPGHR